MDLYPLYRARPRRAPRPRPGRGAPVPRARPGPRRAFVLFALCVVALECSQLVYLAVARPDAFGARALALIARATPAPAGVGLPAVPHAPRPAHAWSARHAQA